MGVFLAQLTLDVMYHVAHGVRTGRRSSRAEADYGQGLSTPPVVPSPDSAVNSEAGAAQISVVNVGAFHLNCSFRYVSVMGSGLAYSGGGFNSVHSRE